MILFLSCGGARNRKWLRQTSKKATMHSLTAVSNIEGGGNGVLLGIVSRCLFIYRINIWTTKNKHMKDRGDDLLIMSGVCWFVKLFFFHSWSPPISSQILSSCCVYFYPSLFWSRFKSWVPCFVWKMKKKDRPFYKLSFIQVKDLKMLLKSTNVAYFRSGAETLYIKRMKLFGFLTWEF